MRKKRKQPIPFDAIGADLAKFMDTKRRLIEQGIENGDMDCVRQIFEDLRLFLQCLLKDLESDLRTGTLRDVP